jgi:hypothetical protein
MLFSFEAGITVSGLFDLLDIYSFLINIMIRIIYVRIMNRINKGFFKPLNPQKYRGDPTQIIWRSRWESRFMSYLDRHSEVLEWSSEEIRIPYKSPLDSRKHTYYPDFWVKTKDKNGNFIETVYEIKPEYQTKEPKPNKNKVKHMNSVKVYLTNTAKWKYAEAFCEQRGWGFRILTEKDLGLKF